MGNVTPEYILGFATAILDLFGMRTIIAVILFVFVAGYVWDRFFASKH